MGRVIASNPFVGGGVQKMFVMDSFDVLSGFNDGWPQIFVTLHNEQVLLLLQLAKGPSLVWQ